MGSWLTRSNHGTTPYGALVDADRPVTDWEARVAKAKQEGTWYGPDEEPSPYPPGIKRKRFLTGFALTVVAGVVLGPLLHLVTGRPGSPISGDALLDSLFRGVLLGFFVGWSCTRAPRRTSRPHR